MSYGILRETIPDGRLTRIHLSTPRAFDFPERVVFAETDWIKKALETAYGLDWRDRTIEYATDTSGRLTWFSPIPESKSLPGIPA